MFDLKIENRLPALISTSELTFSEQGVDFVYHNGLPVISQDGELIFTRFKAVFKGGIPVSSGGNYVVSLRS